MTAPALNSALTDVTPYITAWEYERPNAVPIVGKRLGIAYLRENPYDRDSFGVLWSSCGLARGQGRPDYGRVHPQRQRQCMGGLLCQRCAGPADENEQGVLWLLDAEPGSPSPAEGEVTAHPPVCRGCAAEAIRRCPPLRRGHALIRVKEPEVSGVHGMLYRPTRLSTYAVATGRKEFIPYTDPMVRWVLAGQLYARLFDITPATHDELIREAA
ncbi:hypothetical protein [Streptomyces luteireticuli]|uniref:hypothetical protein n=1 Tax=Streptomyces luteireticuli TaxID=173858 RepID=UPI0031D50FB4